MRIETKFEPEDTVCFRDISSTRPDVLIGHILGVTIRKFVGNTSSVIYTVRCYSYRNLLEDPGKDIPMEEKKEVDEQALYPLVHIKACCEKIIETFKRGNESKMSRLSQEENSLIEVIRQHEKQLDYVQEELNRCQTEKEKLEKVKL